MNWEQKKIKNFSLAVDNKTSICNLDLIYLLTLGMASHEQNANSLGIAGSDISRFR